MIIDIFIQSSESFISILRVIQNTIFCLPGYYFHKLNCMRDLTNA